MQDVLGGHKQEDAIRAALDRARDALQDAVVLVCGEGARFSEHEQVLLELANEAVRLNRGDLSRSRPHDGADGGASSARHAEAPSRRTKPYERRKPAPVHVQYRMAYVGTVSIVGADAEPLRTWRYASSSTEGPERVLASLTADIRNVQERHQGKLPVGIVQDGAPELWNLMRTAFRQAGMSGWLEVIDRYHLMEHLAAAAAGFPMPLAVRAQVLRRWRRKLNRDDTAAKKITTELRDVRAERLKRYRKLKRAVDLQDAATIASQLGYLDGNRELFRYARVIRAGLPIGSGATEGACKSLIMIRAKGCGQRWKPTGIQAVLALRGQYTSERMPHFWPAYAADYEADVRSWSHAA
jgi:hypothetical protein